MNKRIVFHSMAYSGAIEKYISQKFEKVYKFFKREPLPIIIDVMLEPDRDKDCYKVACKINSISYHIAVQAQGLDLHAAIDQAIMKVIKQITKKKERLGHNLHASYSA